MNFPKLFALIGLFFVGLGGVVCLAQRIPGANRLGKLPGDIYWEGKNGSFYFPLATCLLLSLGLTLFFWLIRTLKK